jgi:hypothetical protein
VEEEEAVADEDEAEASEDAEESQETGSGDQKSLPDTYRQFIKKIGLEFKHAAPRHWLGKQRVESVFLIIVKDFYPHHRR